MELEVGRVYLTGFNSYLWLIEYQFRCDTYWVQESFPNPSKDRAWGRRVGDMDKWMLERRLNGGDLEPLPYKVRYKDKKKGK